MPILSLLTTTRSRLLSSTAFIRYYAAGGFNPEFVADFVRGEYSAAGNSTFASTIDHSASGLATMTGGYGSELVTNGGFSDGSTGWLVSNEDSTHFITFENDTARYVSGTTSPTLTLSQVVLEAGKTYEITVSCIEHLGGGLKVDGTTGSATFAQSVGVTKGVFTSSGAYLNIYRTAPDTDVTIDNISVRE